MFAKACKEEEEIMADIKKKHKFSFRKLVYNDRYLIACSIIAAVVIWVVTSMNLSPETTKKNYCSGKH